MSRLACKHDSKWSGANTKIGERSETSVALERDKCGGASRLCFDAAHPPTCNLGWIHLQHTRLAVAFARWNFFIIFRRKNNLKCDSYTRILEMNTPLISFNTYFSLCSVSFVLFRGIYYITPHYYSLSEKFGSGFDCNIDCNREVRG